MKVIKIDKAQFADGYKALQKVYKLFGPVKEKAFYNFKELVDGRQADLSFQNTRLSPKSIVFPQSEDMFTYTLDEASKDANQLKPVPEKNESRAVIGIRPCDAKAISLVRMNFDTQEYKDPYWLNLFNATTFVGLACDSPCQSCFCTTAGCGPYHEDGLDILLSDQTDHFLAKELTDKGAKLMKAAGWKTKATAGLEDKKKTAESKITAKISTDNLSGADTLALYNANFWEDASFACINCGTCTFVCPTCWCFDIQDEVHAKNGKRMRNWDSCMFPIFTVHTTGHNPRETKLHRVRQRFMHKLKYFVDKYEKGIMCVGCGRCVSQCPVNIDIRKISELMNKQASKNICAVQK
ncbi:MAG: 4Fe-4S ferredoxin [Desulfobacteraceae bacterium]|nr:4Fe-4S ferredoxin [Desulfobacteraceae bacterium]